MYQGKRHYNCKLSYDDELLAIEKYQSGLSLEETGKFFNVNGVTIRNVLKGHNIERRKTGNPTKIFDKDISDKIISLYNSGLSQENIAKKFNTAQSKISTILRFNGIECGGRSGVRHHNWNGGKHITNGYVFVLIKPDSPYSSMAVSNGYVMEHRLVMAQHLQRPLTRNETVHHINGNTQDNRIENLQLRHGKHGKHQVFVCCDCGSHNVKSTTL